MTTFRCSRATFHHPIPEPAPKTRVCWPFLVYFALLVLACDRTASAKTVTVEVAPNGSLIFSPPNVSIKKGDTVMWVWRSSGHSATSGTPGHWDGLFDSTILNAGATYSFTYHNVGMFPYYCGPHGFCCGMTGRVTVADTTPPPPPSDSQLLNISTRMRVLTGDNVLIGGFIVTGTEPKKVIVRAIGPSLSIAGKLADPNLELVGPSGTIATNDNWMDAPNKQEIMDSTVPPTNARESAILTTLPANKTGYTAIVRGAGNSTGVALVEVYDMDQAANSQLANISTRGFVDTGNDVMIGGVILGPESTTANVLIRALGPSLAQAEVSDVLADPMLELRDADGMLVMSNDDWKSDQQSEIEDTGIPPTIDLESAMVVTVPAAAYTAIVSGKNGGTGVGLVELYRLP